MRMPDYQVTGEGKVTVFLLHGIYGSKDYWRFQTERLVAGEVDQVGHPAGMKRVADMIAGCEFAVVPGSGHYPWAENPAEFNRHYFGFFDRHFSAGNK